MIDYDKDQITITCDKCLLKRTVPKGNHNIIFYVEGWRMNHNARKYIHLCQDCLKKNRRKNRLQPSLEAQSDIPR